MSRRNKSQSDNETPSILKVFGPVDDEEKKRRIKKRKYFEKHKKERECPIDTEYSIRAILTPMGNKR